MARPIRARPTVPSGAGTTPGVDAIASDLGASAESIRELLALVRLLEERGVLRFSSDLLRSQDRVIEVLTDRIDPATLGRSLRNLEVLLHAFERLDPATLAALAGGVPAALEEARRAEADRPMGLLEIATTLRDPEVNRGVRMMLGFLRGIGRSADA